MIAQARAALILTLFAGLAACQPAAKPSASTATKPTGQSAPTASPVAPAPAPVARVSQSQLRERAIDELEAAFRSDDAAVRANAVEAAGKVRGRLSPIIRKGLADPNLGVRAVAATTIGREGFRDLAEETRPLLADPSPLVRTSAIFALNRNRAAVDPSPIADLLLTGPTASNRAHAAFLLGELGNRSALPLLRQALNQPVPGSGPDEIKLFQLQLAEAMVKLGADDQRQVIRAALYPSRAEELEAAALAAQILGEIRDRAAIDQLVYLSEYTDPTGNPHPAEVRLAATASLAKLGVKGGAFIPDQYLANPSPVVRSQVAFTYGNIGGAAALARLEGFLADPSPSVRVAAAFAVLRATER